MCSTKLENIPNRPKILIFIKPFDDNVFQNFLTLLSYIKRCQIEMEIELEVIMP